MKKQKIVTPVSDLPRTPKDAMAPASPVAEDKAMSDEDKAREGNYDLDHLLKAEDIKSDPKRMDNVLAAHKKRMTGMRSIQDLKTAAQALAHDQKAASMPEGTVPAQGRAKQRYPKDSK